MKSYLYALGTVIVFAAACSASQKNKAADKNDDKEALMLTSEEWGNSNGEFSVEIPTTGRYKISVFGSYEQDSLWIEDYIDNNDARTYNITGNLSVGNNQAASVVGSPLQIGQHQMRINGDSAAAVDSIQFELIQLIPEQSDTLTQNMEGEEWKLVWSDEFEGNGLPDSTKWTHNVGNWGWGNNELQYYTNAHTQNTRIENGNLIIEAIKDEKGNWTSGRLTTQGKVSFEYGRIEYRAKVPTKRGVWSAGWLLGDSYRDEISWPYCGEIDVLECVGYEINDTTGVGINHATCHTRAYYFKQNNQIGREIAVDSMNTKFHTYAVEWYPNRIEGYLDGEHYYTYDKNANDLEWPFHQPQNIIVNLAIGGGWGGLKGLDPDFNSQQFVLDYVRVYQKK